MQFARAFKEQLVLGTNIRTLGDQIEILAAEASTARDEAVDARDTTLIASSDAEDARDDAEDARDSALAVSLNLRGDWAPSTAYDVGPPRDWVVYEGQAYIAISSHTSGALFADDLADGKWIVSDEAQLSLQLANENGSSLVGFIQAGTGAVARTMQDKARETVSLADFASPPATALQSALDSLDTGNDIYTGGVVEVAPAYYAMGSKIVFENGTTTDILGLTVSGKGKQASTLSFSTQAAGQPGFEYTSPIFAGVNDLCIRDSKSDGIKIIGYNTNPSLASWNHFNLDRVRLSFNAGSGIEADRGFMGHFNQVFSTHNAAGGFLFNGLHTSLHFDNCYAASNTGNGYRLNEVTYSVMTACAADTNTQYGYAITKSSTTVLNGCGAESNGRSGFIAESSTALGENRNIQVNGLLAFNNNTSNTGYPNAIYVKASDSVPSRVTARGCRSQSPAYATVDALVSGVGAYFVDEDNDFPIGTQSSAGGYVHHVHRTKYVRSLSVTGPTVVCTLMSPHNPTGVSYGGELLIIARNNEVGNSAANTATYKLVVDRGTGGSTIAQLAAIGLVSGAGASFPSFTWTHVNNTIVATPIGSTSGTFYFEILASGPCKVV